MLKNKISFLSLLLIIIAFFIVFKSVFVIAAESSSKITKLTLEESINYAIIGSILSIYILWKLISTLLWLNSHPLRIWGLGFTGSRGQLRALYEEYSVVKRYLKSHKQRGSVFLYIDRFSILIFLGTYYIIYSVFVQIKNIYPEFFFRIFQWSYHNILHSAILIVVFCAGIPVLLPLLISKMIFQRDLALRERIKREMDRKA